MIVIDNVSFRYLSSTKNILTDFSLTISKGEFVGIIGPTGCGKSTICYMMNGLIPNSIKGHFTGKVTIAGKNSSTERVEDLSTIVGYMLQEPDFQIATPNVESEIVFGMENLGLNREEMSKRLESVLENLNLTNLRHRSTSELSEGEKQRVILASILAMGSDILVLDECSSMLDITTKYTLARTLKQLNTEQKKTIVVIEHDLDFLLELVDRVVLINDGKLVADSPTCELLTDYELLVENMLYPPKLVRMFKEYKEKNLPLKTMPCTYNEAGEKLREWLK